MLDSLCLPFQFDVDRLVADLRRIAPDEWVAHFNTRYYEGDWSGIALRSTNGQANWLYPDPTGRGRFSDTELVERCPYFREVLGTLQCEVLAARLLRLSARSSIREHRDHALGIEDGEFRLHIPIVTNADVAFFLNGQRVMMQPGECWYLHLNLPHRVENHSDTERVHLVIDCVVNDWVRSLFPEGSTERNLPIPSVEI